MLNTKTIQPVILAGGSGTRLWPLSRDEMPKQFCKINGEASLFQRTIARVSDTATYEAPAILTNRKHASIVKTQMLEMGIEPSAIILEPCGRDTCAAIALAVHAVDVPKGISMMVMPSDHLIKDDDSFHAAAEVCHRIAKDNGAIVTMGIEPDHPETGYGYLMAGAQLKTQNGYDLACFIEKPDAAKATELVQRDDVYWNAGLFVFQPNTVALELAKYQSKMDDLVRQAVASAECLGQQISPNEKLFSQVDPVSFDYGVMEHTDMAAVVPVSPNWSDLGSWTAIWETTERDENGNAHRGNVYSENASNNLVFSDGPTVGVSDLTDVVVVANRDAILVTSRENAQGVKALVQDMSLNNEKVATKHCSEERPWGRFDSLDVGNMHQVKRIKVVPAGRLSLQYHHHRAEHWIVVSGIATVTVNEDVMQLVPGQQVFIPQGAVHRLENLTDEDVEIIEVQYGHYLGEDDIVRVEDIYGRDPIETPSFEKAAA